MMGYSTFPQRSRTGASPSDDLVSYPEHLVVVVGGYPSAEMQSVYSTALTNMAVFLRGFFFAHSYMVSSN